MTSDGAVGNVPKRDFHAMKAQPIIAWTLPRLAKAFGTWVMEENGQMVSAQPYGAVARRNP
jgi:hypothetical protein